MESCFPFSFSSLVSMQRLVENFDRINGRIGIIGTWHSAFLLGPLLKIVGP